MTNAEARFNKIHIRKVYACLAVTCHLHFWQNDRDFLRATVVTRGWNGYRNKSQHRKSTLEKKILPPFQQGFEPATFQSRVRCSNHWAIPAPYFSLVSVCPDITIMVDWAWKTTTTDKFLPVVSVQSFFPFFFNLVWLNRWDRWRFQYVLALFAFFFNKGGTEGTNW